MACDTGEQNVVSPSVRCIVSSGPTASGRMSLQQGWKTTASALSRRVVCFPRSFVTTAVPTDGNHSTLRSHRGKYFHPKNSEIIGQNNLMRPTRQNLRITSNQFLISKNIGISSTFVWAAASIASSLRRETFVGG